MIRGHATVKMTGLATHIVSSAVHESGIPLNYSSLPDNSKSTPFSKFCEGLQNVLFHGPLMKVPVRGVKGDPNVHF